MPNGKCPLCGQVVRLKKDGQPYKNNHECPSKLMPTQRPLQTELLVSERFRGAIKIVCGISCILLIIFVIFLASSLPTDYKIQGIVLQIVSVVLLEAFLLSLMWSISINYTNKVSESLNIAISLSMFVLTMIALIYAANTLTVTNHALDVTKTAAEDTNFSIRNALEIDKNQTEALVKSLNLKLDVVLLQGANYLTNHVAYASLEHRPQNKFPNEFESYIVPARITDENLLTSLLALEENINAFNESIDLMNQVMITSSVKINDEIFYQHVWEKQKPVLEFITRKSCKAKLDLNRVFGYTFINQPDVNRLIYGKDLNVLYSVICDANGEVEVEFGPS
ncbi:Uncharacterised protein [uncultured archaeon]|nr:Uncharacterised protein [uncultured archaeon]